MLENPRSGSRGHDDLTDDSVVDLASRGHVHGAVGDGAVGDGAGAVTADPDLVQALLAASLSEERRAFVPVLVRMHAARISDRQIADLYLPAVARLLGAGWCDDSRSFAQVTIGVARLQSLLADLGPEWRTEMPVPLDAAAVLVVVSDGVDHSFGAKLLVGQSRRRGLSVRLVAGRHPDDIRTLLTRVQFDAVMISAAICDDLAPSRQIVQAVKGGPGHRPPVVIGGGICALGPEVRALTGADHVTFDIDDALRFCRLTVAAMPPVFAPARGVFAQSGRG